MFLARRHIIGARLRATARRLEADALGLLDKPLAATDGALKRLELDAQNASDRIAADIAAASAAAAAASATAATDSAIEAKADAAIEAQG